jgi:DNA-binding phage protein
LDFEQIAREFLRELRGTRSQVAWSRRLGYRSNVAYAWESGRRWPTAAETMRACRRSGIDVHAALTRFYGRPPTWIDELDPAEPEAIARMLTDLRGQASVSDLARRASLSRYRVTRWLSGHTQPRLPDFLRVIEAASVRMVDFVGALVDPLVLPSVAPLWRRIEAHRNGAAQHPWTQGVLRALELNDYLALPEHDIAWIAQRLDISLEEAEASMEILKRGGAATRAGKHWKPEGIAVDTRRYPEVGRRLKRHWSEVAADRITGAYPGQFSYNVFTVSRSDFEQIRTLHLAYFHALRQIVAASTSEDVVAVANVQLFALDDKPANHAASDSSG